MDSSQINQLLLGRFSDVCAYLLPNGKVRGNHYLVGNIQGDVGETLQITLSGAAAGRFIDFANKEDKGASPLWLWHKSKGITYSEACKQAKEWLGVKDDDFGIKKTKSWAAPAAADRNGVQLLETNCKAMDYLIGERRLDPITVAKAKVAESKDGEWIVFPYFDPGAKEAFHIKKMKVERPNGKKEMFASKGTKRSLYGKQLIDDNASELVISEGEIDGLSWHSWSLPGVSVPNGVSDFAWIEEDWDWLERFEKIYVCMDMDEPGHAAAQEICKRLGLHRCFIVTLPKKDVNECLQEGLKREDMLKFLAEAKAIEMDEIKRPNDYIDEIIEYHTTDYSKQGWETPWYPALPWRVRKGEFTVLSGFSGSGKTAALQHLSVHLVQQGVKLMISSLEIKPGMTLGAMTRTALGRRGSATEARGCTNWLQDSVYVHDLIGTATKERLLHAMNYARKRHGIDVFIIDSLFKCGLDPSDFGAQRAFADEMTSFCNNTGAHVILVAHARKNQSGNELHPPSKADVSGSSDITNAAFNVIIWFRNKLKKMKLDEAKNANPPNTEEISKWMDQPDGKAILDKQRFGEGEEAMVPIWFVPDSMQFHTTRMTNRPYFRME